MYETVLFYAMIAILFPNDAQYHLERYSQYTAEETNLEYVHHIEANKNDEYWLALNIYHEARDQPILGKMAVAFVTMNRVASKRYPNDIMHVVQDNKQFSWYSDGKSDNPNEKTSWKVAQFIAHLSLKVYNDLSKIDGGADYIAQGATHYHADYVSPYWKKDMSVIMQINTHIFYKP